MNNPTAITSWSERETILYGAHSAYVFCAVRIRQKLSHGSDTETLIAEAHQMVRREVGLFPSEDAEPFEDEGAEALERSMREFAAENYEALSETEAYMWGLGVAGVFHQWEGSTRDVIAALLKNPPKKLDEMTFKELCSNVAKTGFVIEACPSFPSLRAAWLITNTIKHGNGVAFSKLVAEKPEIFPKAAGVGMGNLRVQPHHLRVSEQNFDDITAAIGQTWLDYLDRD